MRNLYFAISFVLSLVSCAGNASSNQANSSQPEPEPEPRTAFSYDGGVIYLYDNSHRAEVNGTSGAWSYCNDMNAYVKGNVIKPYYYVNYGNGDIAVISIAKGMIYFGTEESAVANQRNVRLWHEYRKSKE